MGKLNDHGAFHLALKEVEGHSSEHSDKVSDLLNRVRDVISRSNLLVGPSAESQVKPGQMISAQDWPAFINLIENELVTYEQQVKEFEHETQKEAKDKPSYLLWKALVGEVQQGTDVSLLSSFKKLKALPVFTTNVQPVSLEGVVPAPSHYISLAANPNLAIIFCRQDDDKKVLRAVEDAGYHLLEPLEGMPSDYANLPSFLESYGKTLETRASVNSEKKAAIDRIRPRLQELNLALSDANSVLSIKEKSSLEKNWALVEGYVPTKVSESLMTDLTTAVNGRLIPFIKEEHSSNSVPVQFKYPKFLKIFDSITNLYGTPNYNEINPTLILTISFPLLFGLMFGDLGHGIALACIGFILNKFTKSLSKIGLVLIIAGISGALVGAFFYGELFGQHFGLFTQYLPEAIKFSPSEMFSPESIDLPKIMSFLKFTLYLGIFQITLGFVINIVNNLIQHKKVDALLVSLPRLLFYMAFAFVIFTFGINFTQWAMLPYLLILTPMLAFFLLKPIYEMIHEGARKGLSALGEMAFELFDTGIMFVSNTVSYLRIFAMVVAHVELTSVFYILGGMVGNDIFQWVLIIMGNIFVVLLEGILALAQDLRLHFYEWFNKFYQDSGVRFAPFKLALGVPVKK
ncbi:MAG: hypothetical protein LUP94_00315 [Candidatus Methanomethylicus sp.]|nr:hypothetical protein [Candidatus Methanomethylicus sp.]